MDHSVTGANITVDSEKKEPDFVTIIRSVVPEGVKHAPSIQNMIERLENDEILHIISVDKAENLYETFAAETKGEWRIFAAIKAMHDTIAQRFNDKYNASFEVASGGEIRRCIGLGIPPENILYTNPPKSRSDLRLAVEYGIEKYVVDTKAQIDAIQRAIAETGVDINPEILVRIGSGNTDNNDIDGSFDKRFGINAFNAIELIRHVVKCGYKASGLSFHVGTQKNDPQAWVRPIALAAHVYEKAEGAGIHMPVLDIGGGFPSDISKDIHPMSSFFSLIRKEVEQRFGSNKPAIYCEPGRALCGSAGITMGRVIDVKGEGENDNEQIVTVNTGFYNSGLILGIGLRPVFYRAAENHYPQPESENVTVFALPGVLDHDRGKIVSHIYGGAGASLDTPFSFYEGIMAPSLKEGDFVVVTGTGAYATDLQTNWCSIARPSLIIIEDAQAYEHAHHHNVHINRGLFPYRVFGS